MITAHQIQRHFHARHFEPLLRGISPIGLELAMPLHLRLAAQPAAVIGLALRRIIEMTYGPTPGSRELTAALLHLQNDDGSFGCTDTDAAGAGRHMGDALATAAAIAGLNALLREHASAPHPEAAVARERAIAALAATQADDGLFSSSFDRTHDDQALTAAFILHLLAADDDFRQAVRYADLMNWFDEHADHLDDATTQLWRMAQVDISVGAMAMQPALAA